MKEIPSVIQPESKEKESSAIFLRPASAEFFLSTPSVTTLPQEIMTNPVFQEQQLRRQNLYRTIDSLLSHIPSGESIDDAIGEKLLSEAEVTSFYADLNAFLGDDVNHSRLLLYLPFELLPGNASGYDSDDLKREKAQFVSSYREAWIRLLHETEPRANYRDGDILEPGLPDPERISKAGHLTPELLAKGIISDEEVTILLRALPDTTLAISVAEGAVVAKERGLITDAPWESIQQIIRERFDLPSLLSEKTPEYNDPASPRISSARRRWLLKVQKEEDERKTATILAQEITKGKDPHALLSTYSSRVVGLTIGITGELLSQSEKEKTAEFTSSESVLQFLAKSSDNKDILTTYLQHWRRLDIIDDTYLKRFGVSLTDLSSPLPYDEKKLFEYFGELRQGVAKIATHPTLSRLLYPTVLLYGSRLKGYAEEDADSDAALFFRPEALIQQRNEIHKILKKEFPEFAQIEKWNEYWMEEKDGKLGFLLPEQDSRIFVGEDQVHFLLGGAWIGEKNETLALRNTIISNYVDLSRFGAGKEEKRTQYLGQLELDMLQYRLLHKGYERSYPVTKRPKTSYSHLIDGESTFWDRGYREVATKLFLSRVFLPDLS